MAQPLRALAACAEDLSSVPIAHMPAQSLILLQGDLTQVSTDSHIHILHINLHTYTHTD